MREVNGLGRQLLQGSFAGCARGTANGNRLTGRARRTPRTRERRSGSRDGALVPGSPSSISPRERPLGSASRLRMRRGLSRSAPRLRGSAWNAVPRLRASVSKGIGAPGTHQEQSVQADEADRSAWREGASLPTPKGFLGSRRTDSRTGTTDSPHSLHPPHPFKPLVLDASLAGSAPAHCPPEHQLTNWLFASEPRCRIPAAGLDRECVSTYARQSVVRVRVVMR